MIHLLKIMFNHWFLAHKEHLTMVLIILYTFTMSILVSIAILYITGWTPHPYNLYLYW